MIWYSVCLASTAVVVAPVLSYLIGWRYPHSTVVPAHVASRYHHHQQSPPQQHEGSELITSAAAAAAQLHVQQQQQLLLHTRDGRNSPRVLSKSGGGGVHVNGNNNNNNNNNGFSFVHAPVRPGRSNAPSNAVSNAPSNENSRLVIKSKSHDKH